MLFSWRKKHSGVPSSAPASGPGLAVTQRLQFPTNSQSQSQSTQQTQQSQSLYPWSAHSPPSGQWLLSFPRRHHALSTTPTAAGELFLFGGKIRNRIYNDLYVISTRDFSITLLQTRGDVPSPRFGHRAVLNNTILLIWGGKTYSSDRNAQKQGHDDSLYLLN